MIKFDSMSFVDNIGDFIILLQNLNQNIQD